MDPQRGRSPSAGHQQSHINPSHSPSPHHFQENQNSIGLGLAVDTSNQSNNNQFLNEGFNSNNGLPSYENSEFLNQQGQSFQQGSLDDYNQNQEFSQQFKQEENQSPFSQQQQPSFTQELLNSNISSNFNDGDFSLYSTPNNQNENYDPQLFMNELSPPPGNQSVNPAELNMSSPPNHTSTPPGLLQPNSQSPSSAHQSPSFGQGPFQSSPGHSRHASLGPESAAYPQGQNHEWNMMAPQFQGHRRTPSEYSDVSASSAAPSPNLGHHDSFEPIEHQHSPNLHANDSMYQEVLGIGSFSLSDPQGQHGSTPNRGLSPAHSPAISPRLGPIQLPSIQHNGFMLGINNGFGQPQYPEIQFQHSGSGEIGQAPQMVPDINVEFAPTSRSNSFEPPKPSFDQDALTPPDRGTCNKWIFLRMKTDKLRPSPPSRIRSIQQCFQRFTSPYSLNLIAWHWLRSSS